MRVNLDATGGAALHPDAEVAMREAAARAWADPRASHGEGRAAAHMLHHAREQVAYVLDCQVQEVSFDSSLSAANRRAVRGLALGRQRVSQRLVATAVEHSSILHACTGLADGWLAGPGWEQVVLPVDRFGSVDLVAARERIAQQPVSFVAAQWANSEVGTRQPISELARDLPAAPPFLIDASAGLGIDDLRTAPWSVLTATPTSLGAPSACAVFAVRDGTRWRAIDTPTDEYEGGRVPGRPDLPAICATAAAVTAAWAQREEREQRLRALTDRLRAEIPALVRDSVVLGSPDSVCHTVTMSCLYVSGAALAAELDAAGFAVGSGSACSSDALTPSHVLAAMGALTEGNLRISLPWDADDSMINAFLVALPHCVQRVRDQFGAPHA